VSRRVAQINTKECEPFVLGVHYARRWPSISAAFGLYRDERLVGVVTYGVPASAPLREGVAGKGMASFVWELNRLCLLDNQKNDASFLVSRSLRMVGDKIIVSFADISKGHTGYVYQACNFLYCGLSAKRTDWKVRGREHLHGQTIADEFRGAESRAEAMRAKYGDDFYLEDRPRKHRYIYCAGRKPFRRLALSSLRYPVEPYPKEPTSAAAAPPRVEMPIQARMFQ